MRLLQDDARSCDGLAVRLYVDLADAVLPFVTLLVVNLIHGNILNFLWMNLTAVILVQSAELLFKYLIWRNPDIDVVLINYVLPALIATVILSAPLYLIIRQINKNWESKIIPMIF